MESVKEGNGRWHFGWTYAAFMVNSSPPAAAD
jgi:hypothetical protein